MPFIELLKLVVAALIGLLVTAIHQPASRERGRSMEQAQTLLCVSGAMMMIIIGNSLARAFGIAGAASIIRFRTPVDDPKDVTILFLLMGLGMSVGLRGVCGGGARNRVPVRGALRARPRRLAEIARDVGRDPRGRPPVSDDARRRRVRAHEMVFEPREISQADDVTVKYYAWLDPRLSLEELSTQLMEPGGGVKSVTWEHPKRDRV